MLRCAQDMVIKAEVEGYTLGIYNCDDDGCLLQEVVRLEYDKRDDLIGTSITSAYGMVAVDIFQHEGGDSGYWTGPVGLYICTACRLEFTTWESTSEHFEE